MAKKTTSKTPAAARTTRSTDAAASDLGFSLQRTRFLARLLQAASGDVVCLEVFDDVRLERADGTIVAEEDKSTHGRNPLADRAVDLWKTLANWVNAAAAGNVLPAITRFEIYVSRPSGGPFSELFRVASTAEEAKAALVLVREELWGPSLTYPKRDDVAESIAPYVDEVFGEHLELSAAIIARLDITCGTGNQHADLKPLFLDKWVSEDAYPDVLHWSHGWVKTKLDRLLEEDLPAIIARDEFHVAARNYVQLHDRLDFLRSFAGEPTESEIGVERLKTYVAQLEIVDVEDVDVLAAVNDYLRAAADRTSWSDRGDVDDRAFRTFEDILKRTWKNTKGQVLIEQKNSPEPEQGQMIWLKCMAHKTDLDGLAIPSHFVSGSFHALADLPEIGWHPDYENELKRHRASTPAVIGTP